MNMTDDELRQLWTQAGGIFHGPDEIKTAMLPDEQLLCLLRSLAGEKRSTLSLLRDRKEITDLMLVAEIKERGVLTDNYCEDCDVDPCEAEQIYYAMHRGDMDAVKQFICRLAGRIA